MIGGKDYGNRKNRFEEAVKDLLEVQPPNKNKRAKVDKLQHIMKTEEC